MELHNNKIYHDLDVINDGGLISEVNAMPYRGWIPKGVSIAISTDGRQEIAEISTRTNAYPWSVDDSMYSIVWVRAEPHETRVRSFVAVAAAIWGPCQMFGIRLSARHLPRYTQFVLIERSLKTTEVRFSDLRIWPSVTRTPLPYPRPVVVVFFGSS